MRYCGDLLKPLLAVERKNQNSFRTGKKRERTFTGATLRILIFRWDISFFNKRRVIQHIRRMPQNVQNHPTLSPRCPVIIGDVVLLGKETHAIR